jgi:hypothetical protein
MWLALEYISLLYPGSAANPGAVMQTVPEVMDYLDKKKNFLVGLDERRTGFGTAED